MLTCPVCDTPNEDGSLSCERCNCALSNDGQTVVSDHAHPATAGAADQTVLASEAFSRPTAPRGFQNELPVGHVLVGRYEILARLGQGGMGTVYRVLDRELDRVVALKTIRPDLASNSAALRRLKQETLLARQIAHRNVIRVFDLGVADDLRFITMEFVDGDDLRTLLDRVRKFPSEEALDILVQICRGLHAAHTEDVVHRDLKPHNILVSGGNRVRIVDFGLARSFENTGITHTGTILGTPAYMSPEQALGQHGDARSDFFSFGIIAFELLAGELPFPNQTLSEALISRTRGRARSIESINPELPAWLARIVMRCLERNPADRYQSAQDIAEDLVSRGVCPLPSAAFKAGVLPPGTLLGSRYRIEAEAGEGGMGKVYRATDLDLQRTVALKVVRPDLASRPNTLDQLRNEIAIASQISHKNVLRIHDLGEADGLRFVSMAWAEGEDLDQLLKRVGPLPEERIFELAVEICQGLEAAHEQGISHRDLKPSNILLTSGGHACIADFGLAQSARASAAAATVGSTQVLPPASASVSATGTPRYMSPEQVDGAQIDHRTDIYSLGLILYEMATGRIPFNDDSAFQTMTQRVTENPASPRLLNPALSDRLSTIILRCLERDPAQRYATVRDLLDDLERAPAPLLPLLSAPPPVHRSRLLLPATVACLVAAAAGIWFWQRHAAVRVAPPAGKYVAILPFRAVGSDPNLRYRAEGISEAVSARLSSLNSLHPVSASALEHVDLAQSEEKIGKQVGANLLVRGTVQSQGDRLKVDASIYNIEKHKALWNKSYQGVTEDLFALEDEISNDAERALQINPTLQERELQAAVAHPQNLAAYDLYLKGRDILKKRRDATSARSALGLFEQALKQDDSFALAWTGVADASLLIYSIEKDSLYTAKALAAAENARARNPRLPEVHFTLGSLYSATGRYAEAVDEIKHALELAPNSDSGYIRLGKAYHATGQKDAELRALKKAVELNPFYWYNHKQLGVGYMDAARYEDALREFNEQIAENPSDPSGYLNIGAAYFSQGRWQDGIAPFQKALSLEPSFRGYTNLATAYTMLGRYAEAIPAYEKALALTPNQAWVVRNLAEVYMRAGQKQKADTLYTRAIGLLYDQLQVNSRDASALGDLALCYVAKGNLQQAHVLISRARAINPTDPELMYAAAVVESANGRMSEALAALKGALENGTPLVYCLSDPDLKALRDSPGFEALKKQMLQHTAARRRKA